jgi:nucleotide-binding universal stress UspA family protein
MYQRILVPLDGSKQAESALPLAGKLARIYHAEITLLQVAEYPPEIYSKCHPDTIHDLASTNEQLQAEKAAFCKNAADHLKRLASTIEMAVPKVTIDIQECPVVDAILRTVVNSKIDLIVMSTVGQGKTPWMVGSVTNRILRESPVPVILIRKASYGSATDGHLPQSASAQQDAWVHPGALTY